MATPVLSNKDHLDSARILNLPAPASDGEPIRRIDFETSIEGLSWKDNVRAATTGNIDLSSPGAAIDGVSMVSGNRVLVHLQSDESENGIYVWTGSGDPLTRAADADDGDKLLNAIVPVDEGSSNGGTTWRQTQVSITIDVSDIIFQTFGAAVPDASTTVKGKVELATQGEVDAGTDAERAVTPETAKNASWRGRGKIQVIGDNSNTQFDVTHNFSTYSVHVEVWQTGGSRYKVECDISQPNDNTVRVNTVSAPASGALEVRIREVPTS